MKETINAMQAKEMLIFAADKIISNQSYLTEVDSAIGDGDHGIGMSQGMQRVKEKLSDGKKTDNVYEIFEEAGKVMLMSMGGASGVIFGSLFLGGAKNQIPSEELNTREFAQMFRRSLEIIQKRGKAVLGDKTMVDALIPAVESMEKNEDEGFLGLLKAAEQGAEKGVEDTKHMIAKFGRAKSLMERAVGYQDAGATSVYLIFQGMREYAETLKKKGSEH